LQQQSQKSGLEIYRLTIHAMPPGTTTQARRRRRRRRRRRWWGVPN
jgi:hypothetical protein